MAPINTFSVLAFATAAFAVPYHGQGHSKFHNNKPSGFSVQPYPSANGTGIYASGTGFGTAVAPASETAVVPDVKNAVVTDVETTTAVPTTYADASTTCTSDVTVTTTVKKTVTITPSAASSEAAPVESSSSSEAALVVSSSESSAPAYSAAPTSYSSKAEAVVQTSESAPAAYSSSASSSPASSVEQSSSAASPTMTYAAANKNVDVNANYGSSSSSSSAAPSSTSSSSSKSGKRGLAYNDASLTECLADSSKISWGYNWGSSTTGLSSSVNFIPTLWGPVDTYTNDWSDNAKKAIESGSTHLFSFNEPDLSEQANLSPADAATAYKKYMEPFAGQAKLCAPSVTNGAGSMGLNWLSSFLESCSDCTIDCLNIHWYDSAENVEYFKKHINNAADLASGKQIFLSEFAATGSDDQISTFLETVMPWMDSNDSVEGYAYYMVGEGALVSGTEQSAIGKTYAS